MNDDYERTNGDLRLFGGDGPRVFAKRDVDWGNCTIRVQGDYALVE